MLLCLLPGQSKGFLEPVRGLVIEFIYFFKVFDRNCRLSFLIIHCSYLSAFHYSTSAKCTFSFLNTTAPIPNTTIVKIQKYMVEKKSSKNQEWP